MIVWGSYIPHGWPVFVFPRSCRNSLRSRSQRLQESVWLRASESPLTLTDLALAGSSPTQIWSQQPALQPPPAYSSENGRSSSQSTDRPSTGHRLSISRRSSIWLTEGRSRASRPLSKITLTASRRSRRPTISAPTDFKKVQSGRISPSRRPQPFRPLQLSIYLPGNELPDLPTFWNNDEEEDDVGVERPTKALIKSKSDPMLLRRPSSSFSIPRKPLPSRSSSIDTSRFSMNSSFTFADLPTQLQPRSKSVDRLRSSSIERRTSVATTLSTQEFLDALDCRFPRPPAQARLRSNSSTPEPEFALYRRASEQSLRLRTHLEERQSLEKRLPDLMEEVSPISPALNKKTALSPILDRDDHAESQSNFEIEHPTEEKDWPHPELFASGPTLHKARSSTGSSTLLNPPTPHLDNLHLESPSVTTRILSTAPSQTSLRNRFSQWLLKALPTATPEPVITGRRSSTPLSMYSMSATAADLSSAHTKQSSMSSSYWTRPSVDVEKAMVPIVPAVGMAF